MGSIDILLETREKICNIVWHHKLSKGHAANSKHLD